MKTKEPFPLTAWMLDVISAEHLLDEIERAVQLL